MEYYNCDPNWIALRAIRFVWLSPKAHAAIAAVLFHLFARSSKLGSLPNKKALPINRKGLCDPDWIAFGDP